MGDKDKCPPHNWTTVSTTTDKNGNIVSATQECNKCGETRHMRV